ncbi:MAG TPA: hypothetical protein VFQ23_24825 [Anaerolineales bacterium]|nr:hypothetical protein [Anaerolineales bacterium]
MPKTFYTEKDIEELFKSGTRSLQVNDNVSLTDLAYERAKRLGMQLLFADVDLPPIAPIRPYLSNGSAQTPTASRTTPKVESVSPAPQPQTEVAQRIRSAVLERLGNQVDAKLLDSIIQRVVKATGVK